MVLEHSGQEQVYSDDTPPGALGGVDTPFGGSAAHVDALARVYREYADFLQGAAAPERVTGMTLEEGLRSVAVCEAITKSLLPPREGDVPVPKWVPVAVPKV